MTALLGDDLPAGPADPAQVIEELATAAEPGLVAMGSGRFFGLVIGGVLPAALGADWLTSTWDQNSGMRQVTPAVSALGDVAGRWLLELLDLPRTSSVGWTTGATMANFSGLAAARYRVLERAGWDVEADGLQGAPRVRVLVGAEVHSSVEVALRMLGLGAPTVVAADDQGRLRADALGEALAEGEAGTPTIVVLQAGNVHSGAFDDFTALVPIARAAGAWVHVDGAFGLWAAASPQLRSLTAGLADADSWATDAHKTLERALRLGRRDLRRPSRPSGRARRPRAVPDPIRGRGPSRTSCPSCPGAGARSSSGRRCARSAAAASRT